MAGGIDGGIIEAGEGVTRKSRTLKLEGYDPLLDIPIPPKKEIQPRGEYRDSVEKGKQNGRSAAL